MAEHTINIGHDTEEIQSIRNESLKLRQDLLGKLKVTQITWIKKKKDGK